MQTRQARQVLLKRENSVREREMLILKVAEEVFNGKGIMSLDDEIRRARRCCQRTSICIFRSKEDYGTCHLCTVICKICSNSSRA